MVFVSAGMGGGTGTGAAPVIAEISKALDVLTVGIVTKPFDFERTQKMNTALKGIVEMRKHVDALIIIPNQKLLSINEQAINAKTAFEMVDDVLYMVVKSISEILNNTSYMNVDFSDLESVLKDSGDAHIAIGTASGDNKADEAVQQVINSPLLETSIENAGKMLVHITMSDDAILTDIDDVIANLTAAAHPDVFVISGCEIVDTVKDTITVTVVATSFKSAEERIGNSARNAHGATRVDGPSSEPIDSGNTQQLADMRKRFTDTQQPTRTEEAFEVFNQSFKKPNHDDDPFGALHEIFKE